MSYLDDNDIGIAFVQETWLRKSDGHIKAQIEEYGYCIMSYRKRRRLDFGGGVAILYKKRYTLHQVKTTYYNSFESITCKFVTEDGTYLFSNVYRNDYSKKHPYTAKDFCNEFQEFLAELSSFGLPLTMVGDYNFHIECLSPNYTCLNMTDNEIKKMRESKMFIDILEDAGFHQIVDKPTHNLSGTLDLLIVEELSSILHWEIVPNDHVCNSDHNGVVFDMKLKPIVSSSKITLNYRQLRNLNLSIFNNDLLAEDIDTVIENFNSNESVDVYNNILTKLLDKQCPLISKTVRARPNSSRNWFNADLKTSKQKRRKAERDWKKCKCSDHLGMLNQMNKQYRDALNIERSQYFQKQFDKNKSDPKTLYKSVNSMMGDNNMHVLPTMEPEILAEEMTKFYDDKIRKIRSEIQSALDQDPSNKFVSIQRKKVSCSFNQFKILSTKQVEDIINSMSNKNHPSDPIPMWLVKSCLPALLPAFQSIINKSFIEGVFPSSLKHAIVRPILKDKDADKELFKSYRPVSTLPFLSKLIEKAANLQLKEHLNINNLFPSHQSGYRKNHSCETTLIKITDDIQDFIADGKMVALILLDLSSAFDTIDHDLLLNKLLCDFGVSGNALKWFQSYLKGRTFAVRIKDIDGKKCILIYGVPQGSILGPLLFVLYVKDLVSIAEEHGLSIELYADDSQLYIAFSPLNERSAAYQKVTACLTDIELWMKDNYLKVNLDKTNVIFLGNSLNQTVFDLNWTVDEKVFSNNILDEIKSLGIYFDGGMKFTKMINECTKSCYFKLQKLGGIRRNLPTDLRITLVKVYILSKLDYCNSLYATVSKSLMKKLQGVINACARFIYDLSYHTPVTEYLKSAHILPIKYRIMFKLCLIVYKILHCMAPSYLTDKVSIVQCPLQGMPLRSNDDSLQMIVPSNDKNIKYFMAKYWNELPYHIRNSDTVENFKSRLKTYYFTLYFC